MDQPEIGTAEWINQQLHGVDLQNITGDAALHYSKEQLVALLMTQTAYINKQTAAIANLRNRAENAEKHQTVYVLNAAYGKLF